jgi:selenocysteine lyase/cysteine desulfurase
MKLVFCMAEEELLNTLPPYQGGGEMIDQASFEKNGVCHRIT